MAIVVAPYNPWRENLATQILGSVAQDYLSNRRTSELNKKTAALLGQFQLRGEDHDAAAINRMVDAQRERSAVDAMADIAARKMTQGFRESATGAPVTEAAPAIAAGISGASAKALPTPEPWAVPAGVPIEQILTDRIVGSYTPPAPHETENWNVNNYNPGMANRIPLQFTPEGVFARAAETPNYDFKGMINALADPRYAPYAADLLKVIHGLEQTYTSRRQNNFLDMEAAAKANAAAYQANTAMRHAPTLGQALAAMSSRFAGPADPVTTSESSAAKSLTDLVGTQTAAEKKLQGDIISSHIYASRPYITGGGGYTKTDTYTPSSFVTAARVYADKLLQQHFADNPELKSEYGKDPVYRKNFIKYALSDFYRIHGGERYNVPADQYTWEGGVDKINPKAYAGSDDRVGMVLRADPSLTLKEAQELVAAINERWGLVPPPAKIGVIGPKRDNR